MNKRISGCPAFVVVAMPKDAEAVSAIGESFDTLLAFCKTHAKTGKTAFETKVTTTLQAKGPTTVFGYKKALQCLVDEFAQRCGIILIDGDEVDAAAVADATPHEQ